MKVPLQTITVQAPLHYNILGAVKGPELPLVDKVIKMLVLLLMLLLMLMLKINDNEKHIFQMNWTYKVAAATQFRLLSLYSKVRLLKILLCLDMDVQH